MSEFEQNPVSKATWPWTQDPGTPAKPEGPGKSGALVGFFVGWAIAGLFYYKGHHIAPCVIGSIATIILICALFIPPAFKVIHKALQVFAFWVGKILTYVTLVPFFYLCFPMGRVCFRLAGKDAMNRQFEPDRTSYWDARPALEDLEQYKRQH